MAMRLRDGRGNLVPKGVAEPFRNRYRLAGLISQFHDLCVKLESFSNKPGGEALNLQGIRKQLHGAAYLISNGMPFETCDEEVSQKRWLSVQESAQIGRSILRE